MDDSNENPILKLSGTPYEIGYKHGCQMKGKVHTSIETYERMFKEAADYSWQDAREKALSHITAIEKYNPNYIKEMEGIAEGADVQFEDILILNTRSEIALINSIDGCTSFALTEPKTTQNWLAQNWDWKGEQIDSLVHMKIEQENLPTIQMITEAGIIGKIGCNTAGIGVCLNALVTNKWEPKVPIHLGLRAILESNTFEEAIAKVEYNQMASPANFLIASKIGHAVSMEVSPVQTELIKKRDGAIFHTNHLCATNMKQAIKEEAPLDSFKRLSVIEKEIKNLKSKDLEASDLFYLLSNHENYPYSICSHHSNGMSSKFTSMETVFSIVMNLTEDKLTWIKGKPCEHF